MKLDHWISIARQSWEENNPTLFRALSLSGQLDQALRDAAERTHSEMCELEAAGYNNHEAWEITRERYLILPAEHEEDEVENKGAALFNEAIALQNQILRHLKDVD